MTAAEPATVTVSECRNVAALEPAWRDLEARSNASFFQSWTWTGCLAAERFPDPILVEARQNERIVGLALFNRRGRTLYLGESGDPAMDAVFIEYNGVLTEAGREVPLTISCLQAARHWAGAAPAAASWLRRRVVLSGVNAATVLAANQVGVVRHNRERPTYVAELPPQPGDFLPARRANTRQQLRRSLRHYARCGELTIERADDLARANEFLALLAALHQAAWTARGQPGAFANRSFARFHRELIGRGLARGEIDLLRISAGRHVIGVLYNFRYRGDVLAYQSGFDYDQAGRYGKPGLTCHLQAIELAAKTQARRYDFLAGDDRYKRSLAEPAATLHWIELSSRRSLPQLLRDRLAGAQAVVVLPAWLRGSPQRGGRT